MAPENHFKIVVSFGQSFIKRSVDLQVVSVTPANFGKNRLTVKFPGGFTGSFFAKPGKLEDSLSIVPYFFSEKGDIGEWAKYRAADFVFRFKVDFSFSGDALIAVKRVGKGKTEKSAKFEVPVIRNGEPSTRTFTLAVSQSVELDGVLHMPRWIIKKHLDQGESIPSGTVAGDPVEALAGALADCIVQIGAEYQLVLDEEAEMRHHKFLEEEAVKEAQKLRFLARKGITPAAQTK